MVFVSLVEGISQCEQLADAVRRGPLDVDLDFPYHPHVTVAHHLPDDRLDLAFTELADFECQFTVADFHLYVHDAERRLATVARLRTRRELNPDGLGQGTAAGGACRSSPRSTTCC